MPRVLKKLPDTNSPLRVSACAGAHAWVGGRVGLDGDLGSGNVRVLREEFARELGEHDETLDAVDPRSPYSMNADHGGHGGRACFVAAIAAVPDGRQQQRAAKAFGAGVSIAEE